MSSADVASRYMTLSEELVYLEENPFKRGRAEMLASFLERAAALAEDTRFEEPGPLLLYGVGARLSERWELAERSFRAVTRLRPDLLEGWLDLTWALAVLERWDEAESCARRAVSLAPESPAALGNMANVLLQRGDADQAEAFITRAVTMDPTDVKNQMILEHVRDAKEPATQEAPSTPWYAKLFGRRTRR